MAVTKAKKTDILNMLKDNIKNAQSVAFTTNKWLTVWDITKLRKSLREVNSTFTLAKKTLIKIAFKEVYWVELSDSILQWQIAVVCSNEDAVSALWKVNSFAKEFKVPKIVWAWSYFEWSVKDAEETTIIASIPSRETLLWRLVWSMQSPIASLARFFDSASKKLTEEWRDTLWSTQVTKKVEVVETPVVEPTEVEAKEEVATEVETPETATEKV